MAGCQVCKKEYENDEQFGDKYQGLPYCMWPHSFGCCSFQCHYKAIQMNGAWNLRSVLKNLNLYTFQEFQEVFNFDEAGGYATEKYSNAIRSPFFFMMSLDKDNFFKLIRFEKKS